MKFSTIFMTMVAGAMMASSAPLSFNECPAVGADTSGCELLITVTAVNGSGAATAFTVAASSPDQGPFDSSDDTLVGIVNSSSSALKSITLTAFSDGDGIFDFDGDGACEGGGTFYSPGPGAAACGAGDPDTTTYGHGAYTFGSTALVAVTFSGIGGTDNETGTVNFGGTGVAASGSNWFSLEDPLTATQLTGTPEPGSMMLLGSGLAFLGFVGRKRRAGR
jgi:hypothetical protein